MYVKENLWQLGCYWSGTALVGGKFVPESEDVGPPNRR